MNHEKAWEELMKLMELMKEYELEDELEGLIVSIEHIASQITNPSLIC